MTARRLRRPRLTYANVMSTIAVALAIGGGTAYALSVTSAEIANGTVASIDLKNRDVRGIDVALSSIGSEHVRAGSLAASDMSAATRAQVDEITASAVIGRNPGGAGPLLVTGTTYHVTGVTRPAVGRYCIRTSAGAWRGPASSDIVLVSVEWGTSSTSTINAFWHRGATGCPAGQIEVRTHTTDTGAATNNVSFAIAVLRGPTA